MLSMISTPGITGWLGKCPAKNGSLTETFLMPIADCVQHHVDHPVEHQERVAVRDIVHDALDIDQLDRSCPARRRWLRSASMVRQSMRRQSVSGFSVLSAGFGVDCRRRRTQRRMRRDLAEERLDRLGRAPTTSGRGGTSAMTPGLGADARALRRSARARPRPACPPITT